MNLIRIVAVLLATASCSLFTHQDPLTKSLDELKIKTSSGTVQGQFTDQSSNSAVVSWLDILYAQPPVGDLRWRAPRSP